MADQLKILSVGAAHGSIRSLFAKIASLSAKHGPFDITLCTGDFFADNAELDDLLGGKLEPPMECYIMQGIRPLPSAVIDKFAQTGGELCKNVFLMSKSGLVTTPSGLRIACLGGCYEPDIYSSAEAAPGFASPFFASQTTERLLSNALVKSATTFNSKDYTSLTAIATNASSSQFVDILVSNSWPASIATFSSVAMPDPNLPTNSGAQPVDEIVRKLRPKYHFTASSHFWEREPFVWDGDGARVTRFVSMGPFGGEPQTGKKQRWFYALSISPKTAQPRPQNATKNPFTEAVPAHQLKRPVESMESGQNFIFGDVRQPAKRTRTARDPNAKPPSGYSCKICDSSEHFINDCPERQKPPENYICKVCKEPGHFVRDCPTRHAVGDTGGRKPKEGYVCRACGSSEHYLDDCLVVRQQSTSGHHGERRGKRGPPKEIGPDECWFCLSNPSLAKHLIVSIGSECYVTLPKGQIHPTQSYLADSASPLVPGGGHVLIVPIAHFPTYAAIPSDLSAPIIQETDRYKQALRAFYAEHGCGAVLFEVGRTSGRGVHAHIQAVPIPRSLENKVEGAFVEQGQSVGISFEILDDSASDNLESGEGYFKVDLPDGRKMLHRMTQGIPFSIQFGRQVIVDLMASPERMDWKACMLSEDEDRMDAQAFKTAFAPFEPSL